MNAPFILPLVGKGLSFRPASYYNQFAERKQVGEMLIFSRRAVSVCPIALPYCNRWFPLPKLCVPSPNKERQSSYTNLPVLREGPRPPHTPRDHRERLQQRHPKGSMRVRVLRERGNPPLPKVLSSPILWRSKEWGKKATAGGLGARAPNR